MSNTETMVCQTYTIPCVDETRFQEALERSRRLMEAQRAAWAKKIADDPKDVLATLYGIRADLDHYLNQDDVRLTRRQHREFDSILKRLDKLMELPSLDEDAS